MASLVVWESLLRALTFLPLPLLEDAPRCGQMGASHVPQCYWNCTDWQTNPHWRDSKARPVNYRYSEFNYAPTRN